MKILFFIDCFPSGGKERRLVELMKMLKLKEDIQFELVVMSNEIYYTEVFDLGINIHYVIRRSKKDISVFNTFYKLCKHYKTDIIHCWDSMTAIYLAPISKLLNIKFVNGMITNTPLQQNIFNKRWLRAQLTFPFSTIIIGNSYAGLKAYNAPKKKSFCIHNGFNFQRIIHLQKNDHAIKEQLSIKTEYIVGMVASFSESKDYKTYYAAAEIMLEKRKDITFLAIGNNTDSPDSIRLVRNDLINNFRFLGKQSNIESFINIMDVCVLSTFTEGISNSILEYMALGKPVVATSGGGTNEIVKDNQTGFLISASNPVELAEKTELLLNDIDLRKIMGLAGKNVVVNDFSIDTMVNKYISIYKNSSL